MFLRFSIKKFLPRGRLWLPLFLCFSAWAKDPSQSAEWRALLHLDTQKSVLDSPQFFISGRQDASEELKSSLKAIGSNKKFGKLNLPFECAYPARIKFLKKHFDFKLSEPCSDLNNWLAGLAPETISLVFASYYPNNPASIFGHTFLKINTNQENKISDYAINYLAITPETNGLIFGLKGLLGFYKGQFSIIPYFLKVNEYNHSESRDLFEYHLNLNKDEIDTLLRHLWELENNGHFDYYFFDDNCSYFMLRLLDVARPDFKLAKSFSLDVIPAETVKALYQAKAVTKIDYRPSLYTQINKRLSLHDKRSQVDQLDTLILIEKFKKQARKKWSKKEDETYLSLLKKRATIKEIPQPIDIKPRSYPHETHAPKVLSVGGGVLNDQNFSRLSFRPGVHGILDPEAGYLPFSQANLAQGSLRFFNNKQVFFDRFTLIDIMTLNPHLSWDPKISWHSKIEYNYFDQSFCQSCKTTTIMTGIGKTISLSDHQILSFFTNAQIVFSHTFNDDWTYGLHPEILYHLSSKTLSFELGVSLLNRFDENIMMDSIRSHQSFALHLQQNQGLKVELNYFSALKEGTKDRKEIILDWIYYL